MGFNELLQEAAKIKGAQMATMRTDWDTRPQFFQNTLFHGTSVDAVKAGRALPCRERIAAARGLKDEGSALFRDKKYVEASTKYEHALAMLHYVQPNRDDWKSRGLLDSDLDVVDYVGEPDTPEEVVQELQILKGVLYTNIAAGHYQFKNWTLTITACDYALEFDRTNVKALYRRAKSYTQAPTSGGMELEMALADLKAANRLEPTNRNVLKELKGLRKALKQQKQADKDNYSGLFDRGEVCTDETDEKRKEREEARRRRTYEENMTVIKQIEEWKVKADALERAGKHKEAAELYKKYKEGKEVIDKWEGEQRAGAAIEEMDFLNPSKRMIDDAAKNGLDLKDPAIRKYMQTLHERKRQGQPLFEDDEEGAGGEGVGVGAREQGVNPTTESGSGVDWRIFFAVFIASILARYFV
jgi:tetratricopeptide (TPR) repeat protein